MKTKLDVFSIVLIFIVSFLFGYSLGVGGRVRLVEIISDDPRSALSKLSDSEIAHRVALADSPGSGKAALELFEYFYFQKNDKAEALKWLTRARLVGEPGAYFYESDSEIRKLRASAN